MRPLKTPPHVPRAGLWQRWVLVLVMQALLALTLTAGHRAIVGPLHLHEDEAGGGHSHGVSGSAQRHWHASSPGDSLSGDADAADMVSLDGAAQAAQDLPGSAAASAAATLLPAFPAPLAVPRPDRERWADAGPATRWADADLVPPEPPPRG